MTGTAVENGLSAQNNSNSNTSFGRQSVEWTHAEIGRAKTALLPLLSGTATTLWDKNNSTSPGPDESILSSITSCGRQLDVRPMSWTGRGLVDLSG